MNDMLAGRPGKGDRLEGDTPALRLFGLLEVIAERDQAFNLQSLVEETGLPKPTVHRMLQQLEAAGMLQRVGDGRQYGTGLRLRRLAENLLLNNTSHGARHVVLRKLVEEVGESCNLTAFSNGEVLYLDRVETAAPLRFYLHPGSRVPAHCSATGKLFLAQLAPAQRQRLLAHVPLERYTANTLTDFAALDAELDRVKANAYALDDEEFLPGLFCIGVLVPAADGGKSNLGVALQAPVMRVGRDKIMQMLPALQRAAQALAKIEAESGSAFGGEDGEEGEGGEET